MKPNTCCKKMAKQCTNELVTEYLSRNKCDTQRPNDEASCDETRRLINVSVEGGHKVFTNHLYSLIQYMSFTRLQHRDSSLLPALIPFFPQAALATISYTPKRPFGSS